MIPAPRTRTLRAAIAVVVALVGVWAGARLHAARDPKRAAVAAVPQSAVRVPAGEASPPTANDFAAEFEQAMPQLAKVPEHIPDFSLRDKTGQPVSIGTYAGKSLILNFWATWCAPCRREIPLLKSLSARSNAGHVEVVGIAVDYPDKVLAYAKELDIGYPLLIGEQDALDVAAQFGVDSPVFPFTVFTDHRGDIVTLFVGELHKPQVDLILSVVQHLDADQMGLPEARRRIAAGLQALAPTQPG